MFIASDIFGSGHDFLPLYIFEINRCLIIQKFTILVLKKKCENMYNKFIKKVNYVTSAILKVTFSHNFFLHRLPTITCFPEKPYIYAQTSAKFFFVSHKFFLFHSTLHKLISQLRCIFGGLCHLFRLLSVSLADDHDDSVFNIKLIS